MWCQEVAREDNTCKHKKATQFGLGLVEWRINPTALRRADVEI